MDANEMRRINRMEINTRATRWLGTWNNYQENFLEVFQNEELLERVSYLIVGKETAPTTGTPHLHFYIRFSGREYRNTVKRWLPNTWLEVARGSELANIQYVSKVEKIFEYGTPTMETTKTMEKEERLKEMLKDLMEMDWNAFEAKYPTQAFYQMKKLQDYKIQHLKAEDPWNGNLPDKNYWVFGKPGTGKSKWCRTRCSVEKLYPKNTNKWWDGFNPTLHQVVIMEDFPSDGMRFAQLMKIWSDRYSFIGEIKGGQILINPGKFFFLVTSNYPIETVFPGEDGEAIRRRFKEIEIQDAEDLHLQMALDFSILI